VTMTDEQSPEMDDVKIRLSKDDIPVEDETVYKSEEEQADVVDEFRNLGRQFGETVRAAWNRRKLTRLSKTSWPVIRPRRPRLRRMT